MSELLPETESHLISEVDQLHRYYSRTANQYETLHFGQDPEHDFALAILSGLLPYFSAAELLDVGAGTGRTLHHIKKHCPSVRVVGIEPVEELRAIGYGNGLSEMELCAGDGCKLQWPDKAFDVVCAFAVLHHVRRPDLVLAEMLRVSRKAVFISDSNNFGQGSWMARITKQTLNAFRLWRIADQIKTRGRGYTWSEEDGISYSYSVFNNLTQLRKVCRTVHQFNTRDASSNLYRTASHVAILGIK